MKLNYRQIEPFVKSPDPTAQVILIYGPDDGLMRERAKTIALTVVEDLNDAFNVARLSAATLAEDPARLNDEAHAISMMGGKRLVRVEDVSDKLTVLVKAYLENPAEEALIVLEAGELGPRSSLRKLCEQNKAAAAVPCYVEDERDLTRLVRDSLQEEGLGIEPDATAWLAANISGDRLKARGEINKLITYKGAEKTPVTLEDVQACCGTAGVSSIDDLVYGVGNHRPEQALSAYHKLLEEGVNFIVVLRSLQNHFRRLHATRARMEEGQPLDQAMKSLAPPVFFKQADAFKAQINGWRPQSLFLALSKLATLEADCKKTGAPAETLCAQAILGLSRMR